METIWSELKVIDELFQETFHLKEFFLQTIN